MPLCAGPGYSEADLKAPYTATPAQLEALSAKLDSRGYWGSVAEMDRRADLRRRLSHRETGRRRPAQMGRLQGLHRAHLYRHLRRHGLGQGQRRSRHRFTALNTDPVAARNEARATCNAKSNGLTCVATVRCSGRAYISGMGRGRKGE